MVAASINQINATINTIVTQKNAYLIAKATDSSLYKVVFNPNTAVYTVELSKAIKIDGESDHKVHISPIISKGLVRQGEPNMLKTSFAAFKETAASELNIEGNMKANIKPAVAAQIDIDSTGNRPTIRSAQFSTPAGDPSTGINFSSTNAPKKAYAEIMYHLDSPSDYQKIRSKFTGKDKARTLYTAESTYPRAKALNNTNNMSTYHMNVVETARELLCYLSSASSIPGILPTDWPSNAFDDN
jgi:hypothetical protein